MYRHFGTTEDQRCKGCRHLICYDYNRRYYKCELYGISHSEATDWRLSYQACGMYNMHVKRSEWVSVKDRQRIGIVAPIDGQIGIEVIYGDKLGIHQGRD